MPKHRRSDPAVRVDLATRPGLVQLITGAISCLLGLAALTIAINSATGNGVPVVDPTVSSNSGPPSGIDGATMPSVIPASPTPSDAATTSSSEAKEKEDTSDDSDDATDDPTDTTDPTVEPSPTATTSTDSPRHGKPTDPPGKDK